MALAASAVRGSASMIIGQVRATALDPLRGSGLDGEDPRTALEPLVSASRAGQRPDAH
jgi:hypothetical protein